MSFDLQQRKNCVHYIVDEIQQVAEDRKSLFLDFPIASTDKSLLDLKVNGYSIDPKKDPFYSFKFTRDETAFDPILAANRVFELSKRKIIFDRPLRTFDDIFEISYYTDSINCPRCLGQRVEDDFAFSNTGRLITVIGNQKLLQHVRKFVFTVLGSNPFHPSIGTTLDSLIGQKISNIDFLSLKVTEEINTTLRGYLDRQINQATVQEVTDAEFLYQIRDIQVLQDQNDPTIVRVTVTVSNRTFGETQITQDIKLNGAVDPITGEPTRRISSSVINSRNVDNSGLPNLPNPSANLTTFP